MHNSKNNWKSLTVLTCLISVCLFLLLFSLYTRHLRNNFSSRTKNLEKTIAELRKEVVKQEESVVQLTKMKTELEQTIVKQEKEINRLKKNFTYLTK